MQKLLSIIVPVFNISTYLESCINSLLNQTYSNIEIVLIDDGSSDGSEKICDDYAKKDKRIFVIHKENEGICSARKVGTQYASGYYIAFVDGDDWVENDMYESLIGEMERSGLDVISSGYFKENGDSLSIICDGMDEGIYTNSTGEFCKNMIYKEGTDDPGVSASMCNKIFIRTALWDELREVNDDICYGEDAACVYSYLPKANKIGIVHRAFYHYRYRTDSIIHSKNDKIFIQIGMVYLHLKEHLQNNQYYKYIKKQLDIFVTLNLISGINYYAGFEDEAKISMYLVPNKTFSYGNRIVLYGAGIVGQAYEKQLRRCENIEVVKWVDKRAADYRAGYKTVCDVSEILDCEYDVVLLAVRDLSVAEKIREELQQIGISNEKIFWEKPRTILKFEDEG